MGCNCEPETVYTPDPCNTGNACSVSNAMRLYTLRCGTWVYSGQMSMNSAPQRGMRLMWDSKPYTIEQATLVNSEPGIDKWEVMLIQAGPQYYQVGQPNNPCIPCPPPTLPPVEAGGGTDHDSPCNDYYYPVIGHNESNGWGVQYPNTPLPVEIGLGCGPQYTCNGYPH